MNSSSTAAARQPLSVLINQIRSLPQSHLDALGEREAVVLKAFDRFKNRVRLLPEMERRTALSLFYRRLIDTMIEFQLAVERVRANGALLDLVKNEGLKKPNRDQLLAEHQEMLVELEELYDCK